MRQMCNANKKKGESNRLMCAKKKKKKSCVDLSLSEFGNRLEQSGRRGEVEDVEALIKQPN